jgi:hypothetical protein
MQHYSANYRVFLAFWIPGQAALPTDALFGRQTGV